MKKHIFLLILRTLAQIELPSYSLVLGSAWAKLLLYTIIHLEASDTSFNYTK